MAKKKAKEKILQKTLELLESIPEGILFNELYNAVCESESCKLLKPGTIWTYISTFKESDGIYKPIRGLYRLVKHRDEETGELKDNFVKEPPQTINERDFYKPFADWLKNVQEECTIAKVIGGNRFGGRWNTPDVVGIWEPKIDDVIKANKEIISAEIKSAPNELVTAFGQACSYCLFSHKTYLVGSKHCRPEERDRIEALCQVLGIGFVLFDSYNVEKPYFELRVRPLKREPNMYYVNKYLRKIVKDLWP